MARKQQPPPLRNHSLTNYVDNEWILIYFGNALGLQWPMALICESDIPASAA